MSVQILVGDDGVHEQAAFYCTTTDWAFGPVMGSREEAEAFLQYLPGDPRSVNDGELEHLYSEFVREFVCECGHVRNDKCFWCKDGEELTVDGKFHTLEGEFPVTCELEEKPAAGERFQCFSCRKKSAKHPNETVC